MYWTDTELAEGVRKEGRIGRTEGGRGVKKVDEIRDWEGSKDEGYMRGS